MTVCSALCPPSYNFSTEGYERCLTVRLPFLESLDGVDLEMSSEEIRLLLPGGLTPLLIPLPLELGSASDSPTARFSKRRQELTIVWASVVVDQSVSAGVPGAVGTLSQTTREYCPVLDDRAEVQQGSVGTVGILAEGQTGKLESVPAEPELECFGVLKDEIEHALKQCTIKQLKSVAAVGGCSVFLSSFAVEGEASMTKQVSRFKASVSFKWDILDEIGGFLGASGAGVVSSVAPEQAAPNVAINVLTNGSLKAKSASEWVQRRGACLISECLNGKQLGAAICGHWGEVATEDALAAVAKSPSSRQALHEWAEEWLVRKLTTLSIRLFGGSARATLMNPQVRIYKMDRAGDFQLGLECKWCISNSNAMTEGKLSISEVSLGQDIEIPTVLVEVQPGSKVSGQFLMSFKQKGVSAVRSILAQFTEEYQLQVTRRAHVGVHSAS